MSRGGHLSAIVLAALLAWAGAAAAGEVITVGATSSTSDAPIYIADKKGFFRAEGIEVKVSNFRSASDMVAPLGAGQLDAGAGSAGAALYNAVARGIRIAGLRYSDVETVDLPLPDHVVALKNKSVDASASVEPGPAIAVKNGDAVVIKADDEILPNHQIAVLLYSEDFVRNRRADAVRFMRAYIRAVRFYNGALKNGRFQGANADEVIAILSESTPIKSRDIYQAITPTGMNPDGRVNKASLAHDLAFYREQGLIKGTINLDEVVDGSLVEAVLKELGPYRP
jgi:NitT/TauT family transport system substrate-binding protein